MSKILKIDIDSSVVKKILSDARHSILSGESLDDVSSAIFHSIYYMTGMDPESSKMAMELTSSIVEMVKIEKQNPDND